MFSCTLPAPISAVHLWQDTTLHYIHLSKQGLVIILTWRLSCYDWNVSVPLREYLFHISFTSVTWWHGSGWSNLYSHPDCVAFTIQSASFVWETALSMIANLVKIPGVSKRWQEGESTEENQSVQKAGGLLPP